MTDMMKLKISEWVREENADENRYLTAAKELEGSNPKAAGVLRDIAHDEHSHANALEFILKNFA